MSESDRISSYMLGLMQQYKVLRGKNKDSGPRPFWDVVVITTLDEAQRMAFQLQIDEKHRRNELPLDLPILIITDPPGIRIGNGGSTLIALTYLEKEYGDKLSNKKVLLIHAGGWSQRMPSASALGKIFSALPHGQPIYQMLDFKLALYWPFVSKMEPGVLLTCADDFLVFDLGKDSDWSFPANGFTALAHPSPMAVGRTHGVYVLANPDILDKQKPVVIAECLEVLQKPSDERMRNRGAILSGKKHVFAGGIELDGDVVYTDSCFYFGSDVVKKLIDLKKELGSTEHEIDAYGDFMQAVGLRASSDYIHLTSNISQVTPGLLQTRQQVFDHLKGTDIHLLILNASKFIHIGTTKEYIYHLCHDKQFQSQMAFSKDVFNLWTEVHTAKRPKVDARDGCVMHSVLPSTSTVSSSAVIEYCHFDVRLVTGDNTITSNCQYLSDMSKHCTEVITIPEDCFLHTVPISVDGVTKYVTVFFHVDNDLKKSVSIDKVRDIPFLTMTLQRFCDLLGWKVDDLSKEQNGAKINLWMLKLFPALESMTTSFHQSLSMLQTTLTQADGPRPAVCSSPLYAMADLLRMKDVSAMLRYRHDLFEMIETGVKIC
ncbi:fucose-1-phosphate guanylyltransferase-like [Gigantopelta aegis]|uniref:fucose-1-phosphate guanylyltransferase-like n=1 Tax=Gigantopelta aegis TaxID=1735272 RepID=UPI001B88840C|nr:fucose-1-phosphate guanylyltransferase-like [Gigantopelta aegis]